MVSNAPHKNRGLYHDLQHLQHLATTVQSFRGLRASEDTKMALPFGTFQSYCQVVLDIYKGVQQGTGKMACAELVAGTILEYTAPQIFQNTNSMGWAALGTTELLQ